MGCGCGKSPTTFIHDGPEVRRQLSTTFAQDDDPRDAGRGHASDEEESRSLVVRLCQQELVSLIAQLQEVSQGPSLHRNGTNASICSIMTETDRERCRKQSFGDKALRVAGDSRESSERLCNNVGFVCKKGLKPESPNQDSFLIVKVEGRYCIYGVFDGHGRKGHDVSNFVKDQLAKVLVMQPDLETNTANALETTFRITQTLVEEATDLSRIDAKNSGCTATVVFHNLTNNVLFVAHVGDSRAVLGTQLLDTGQWTAHDLTEDHKPNLPAERSRIERAGGQVLFDGYSNYRVYVRGKRYPGLNMSRAMGDLLGFWDAGISAQPDVEAVEVSVVPTQATPRTHHHHREHSREHHQHHQQAAQQPAQAPQQQPQSQPPQQQPPPQQPQSAQQPQQTPPQQPPQEQLQEAEEQPQQPSQPSGPAAEASASVSQDGSPKGSAQDSMEPTGSGDKGDGMDGTTGPAADFAPAATEESDANIKDSVSFISSSASVSSYALEGSDRVMLICSDGVWDFLPSQEAVEIAGGFAPEDSMGAASELARVAWDRWMHHSAGSVVDDITSLVIRFDRPDNLPAPTVPQGAMS